MARRLLPNAEDEDTIREYKERRRTGTELDGHVEVPARVAKDVGTIYSIRFSEPEMQLIEAQAERQQKRLSVFIREAAIRAALEGAASNGQIALTPSEGDAVPGAPPGHRHEARDGPYTTYAPLEHGGEDSLIALTL